MNPTTLSCLLELNRQFYQTFAVPFSATRSRLQPGTMRVLQQVKSSASLLDLGCGNGGLARHLAHQGHSGGYIGLDFSSILLEQASQGQPDHFRFFQADLATQDWDAALAGEQFDFIFAFAVLHHLPSIELRRHVLRKVRALLLTEGRFFHSEWQFLNSRRLAARVQPWEAVGLSQAEVDPGDYLLDWRQGGAGLRYVHHFSEQELDDLANATGFTILETFLSDGENHRLGLYQVWKKKSRGTKFRAPTETIDPALSGYLSSHPLIEKRSGRPDPSLGPARNTPRSIDQMAAT